MNHSERDHFCFYRTETEISVVCKGRPPVQNPEQQSNVDLTPLMIDIDIPSRTVTAEISDEEIKRRLTTWTPPEPKVTRG